jgi:uncharacterized peroxidase-related enzyme
MIFKSIAGDAGVRHILNLRPAAGRLLAQYHQEVMRGPSPLSEAERELIAAYVSALNRCNYCCRTHSATASHYGVPEGLAQALAEDETLGGAPPRMQPLLRVARKLTVGRGSIETADADAVYTAGWSEAALHDAILVTAMFNFMNRLVHGHGLEGNDQLWAERGRYLFENGYSNVLAEFRSRPL